MYPGAREGNTKSHSRGRREIDKYKSDRYKVRYKEKARTLDKKIIKDWIMEIDKRIGEREVSRWEKRRRETLG